jgi:hypothetical protein
MGRPRHTKESIVQALKNLAAKMNVSTLSKQQVRRVLSPSSISHHYGSLGEALKAAGLAPGRAYSFSKGVGNPKYHQLLSDEQLFSSVRALEKTIGHEPTYHEYDASGAYSPNPFKRFGKWSDMIVDYRKWKGENGGRGSTAEDKPQEGKLSDVPRRKPEITLQQTTARETLQRFYGEPIDFRGLRHAPINEQGVVYLFGMVSRELGFNVEAIQQGFPDCEAKYLFDAKKQLWAKARIEFEYKASSFNEHGHDPNQCDYIVCWINDWPESPIRVIELRTSILRLPHPSSP